MGADNPIYEGSGARRVFRGGGWRYEPHNLRCSNRDFSVPSNRLRILGFRLAKTP
ncbi:MAG: SUMF1/EgtB/PvdO family nonheme iron enzyme [SAR324 cluster bacterium]|nr:SUMF1/EgtB/PvdO family nonheme iron enzyme [SAR324 cluster bacterium]